ncbi:MAG: PKD domain-containing protein [Planctomycetes bacterium]|nr:PKD domain-containing protein [Planctomycetota bacterium]
MRATFALTATIALQSTSAPAVEFAYDNLHQLLAVRHDDGTEIRYAYDEAGNRVRKTVIVPPPAVVSVEPPSIAVLPGSVTIRVLGGPFRRDDSVLLRRTGQSIVSEEFDVTGPGEIQAFFVLRAEHAGCWEVAVRRTTGEEGRLPAAFCAGRVEPPAAPACIRHPQTGCAGVSARVEWCPVTGATGYEVEHRSEDATLWIPLCGVAPSELACTFVPAAPGGIVFRVRALSAAGPGAWRESEAFLRVAEPARLAGLPVHAGTACSGVETTVSWSRDPAALRYRLEARQGEGGWIVLGTLLDPETEWRFVPGEAGEISFRLTAENDCGPGPSAEATVPLQVLARPNPPPSLSAPSLTCADIPVSVIAETAPGATSYILELARGSEAWDRVAVHGAPDFELGALAAGDYRVRVRAGNTCGESDPAPSPAGAAVTVEGAPAPLSAPPAHPTSACPGDDVLVLWPCDVPRLRYDVEACGPGAGCSRLAPNAAECWFTYRAGQAGSVVFRVRAVGPCGPGEWRLSAAPLVVAEEASAPVIEASRRVVCPLAEIELHEASGVAASAFRWDFGDGTTSDLPAPRHAYARCGAFSVSVTVETACGTRVSDPIEIVVPCPLVGLACVADPQCFPVLRWDALADPERWRLTVRRDGQDLALLPGTATSFTDREAREGRRAYAIVPVLGDTPCEAAAAACEVEVCDSRCIECIDDPERPFSLGFSRERIQSAEPFDPRLILEGSCGGEVAALAPPGRRGRATLFANVVSAASTDKGVQGWSFGVAAEGEADIESVATDGTSAARAPDGRRADGFEVSTVVDPERNGGRRGAVSAVVLSFTEPLTLAPVGTESVLTVQVQATRSQGEEEVRGELRFAEGLRGSGQPVDVDITIGGSHVSPCNLERAGVSVVFRPGGAGAAWFRRGDANADGVVNISDAIFSLGALFLGGASPPCLDAVDANDDGLVNITDPVFLLDWLFRGGGTPPSPGPHECGPDETPDGLDAECRHDGCARG